VPPTLASDWSNVGDLRGTDASALNVAGRDLAALYMIGYYVECQAKALCLARRKSPPTSGAAGHDIAALLLLAGHRLSDLPADQRRFAQDHRVSLRYEASIDTSVAYDTTYAAACQLGAWLRRRVKRELRMRRRGT
jgi:hypothetical protein